MDSVDSFADLDLSAEAPTSGVTPRSGPRPPSPGTSPLFSTPSSAMSGSTGGCWGVLSFLFSVVLRLIGVVVLLGDPRVGGSVAKKRRNAQFKVIGLKRWRLSAGLSTFKDHERVRRGLIRLSG
jgi:hypothetical protein